MFYCGNECQVLDWQHGNTDVCRSLKLAVVCSRAISDPVIALNCEYIKLCAALAKSCRFDRE